MTRARRKTATADVINVNGDVETAAAKRSSKKKDTKAKNKTGEMCTDQKNYTGKCGLCHVFKTIIKSGHTQNLNKCDMHSFVNA